MPALQKEYKKGNLCSVWGHMIKTSRERVRFYRGKNARNIQNYKLFENIEE